MIDRNPTVAGSFYPSDRKELLRVIENYFNQVKQTISQQPLAIVTPHAGYVFSGEVAAAAFGQIDRNRKFKHIFIIASSHTMYFEGVSVYSQGDFITPLGKLEVGGLAEELANRYSFIHNDPQPHVQEHSIEVLLPFLQYWLKNSFTIIPIIIGGQSQSVCKNLADALAPYFNEENLFVVSSDFSHYPNSVDAAISDGLMADAILANSSLTFMKTKFTQESKGIASLATAMCGWTSMLTLLNITEGKNDITYKKILYKNSGDAPLYGDKSRVVGYHAICAVKSEAIADESKFSLSEDEKIELLKIVRRAIQQYLRNGKVDDLDMSKMPSNLLVNTGAFVTLKEHGRLRGCIGRFNPEQPLYKVVQSMAIAAATEDYRFTPVKLAEVSELEIEISVLTPLRLAKSIDEIILGKHGIYIKKGGRSGTFLPQVAIETGWSLEEFLGHCAQDKASIGWSGWKDAEIYTYEAIVVEEREFKDKLQKD
ncbi:MAG: AmmeMemoRadiSam system protein B [Bacteroidales bacterium]|nr:MAG: AmmeMemoRadiSam system protein B [Bacteroidales bacterium]